MCREGVHFAQRQQPQLAAGHRPAGNTASRAQQHLYTSTVFGSDGKQCTTSLLAESRHDAAHGCKVVINVGHATMWLLPSSKSHA
jgi:hypothetical protein